MLRKIGKHLEMDDLHYNITRRNQHEVSSNEQIQPLDEFPKDLRQDEMGRPIDENELVRCARNITKIACRRVWISAPSQLSLASRPNTQI